jgi:Alanine racemase, N-terminal domain
MALTLYVDAERWHAHLRRVRDSHPGIVPVAKGNGYGFGIDRLGELATWLGIDTVAVGAYAEVPEVSKAFDGTVLVLTPWRPTEKRAVLDDHVVHTVGRLEDLVALTRRTERPRVILERMTSMRRHGFSARDLREAVRLWAEVGGVRLEGVAFHLPMVSTGSTGRGEGSHVPEVERLMTDVVAAGMPAKRIWVSHLTDTELEGLRHKYADFEFRPRIGTALWLGDRGALQAKAAVLDVHPVERGEVFGYRGRTAPKAGHVVVVSGGTSHGIGLEAPTGGASLRDRAARVAKGGLDAAGFVRSPYTIDGKQRLFAEPPHMQASMLFLPSGAHVPEVGDEIDVRVRYTATAFDETVIS